MLIFPHPGTIRTTREPADRADRRVCGTGAVGTAAALVGPVAVEVLRVLGQDRGSVPLGVDHHPVGAVRAA